jgi:hypothetical protein
MKSSGLVPIVDHPVAIGLVVTRKPIRIRSCLHKATFSLECAVDVTGRDFSDSAASISAGNRDAANVAWR